MSWQNLHILVTRPQERAQGLIKALYERNASVLLFPTLNIQSIKSPETLKTKLNNISNYDWLFFISPNAVEYAMPMLMQANSVTELPCRWGAVGAGTKDILNQYGVYDVTYPLESVGAQALLDSLKYYDLKDKKCIVFKGNSGNEQLEAGLREAGAKVTEIVCYQRVCSQDNPQALHHAITEQKIDLIIITSGDALKALHAMLPENSIPILNETPLLVISERIEKIAQTLGFQRIILAKDASDEAIVASISNWVKTRSDNDR